MFWKKTKPLEPLTLRHAEVPEAKMVRYLVYRTPQEHVAVVAENALMALKLSEVKEPHKIVRDLPMSGKEPLRAERMTPKSEAEQVALPLTAAPEKSQRAEIPPVKDRLGDFSTMKLAELHKKKPRDAFILPPESALEKL